MKKYELRQFIREEIQNIFKEQEVVYMAPKNRSYLSKYNEKLAKIIDDEGDNVTIEFEDGKKLTSVPKTQLRHIK